MNGVECHSNMLGGLRIGLVAMPSHLEAIRTCMFGVGGHGYMLCHKHDL